MVGAVVPAAPSGFRCLCFGSYDVLRFRGGLDGGSEVFLESQRGFDVLGSAAWPVDPDLRFVVAVRRDVDIAVVVAAVGAGFVDAPEGPAFGSVVVAVSRRGERPLSFVDRDRPAFRGAVRLAVISGLVDGFVGAEVPMVGGGFFFVAHFFCPFLCCAYGSASVLSWASAVVARRFLLPAGASGCCAYAPM